MNEDYQMKGEMLERRVQSLLEGIFTKDSVKKGRESREDLIITPPASFKPSYPLVVEVKGSGRKSPTIEDLRQLHHWVSDLSQEGEMRRTSLRGAPTPRANAISLRPVGHPKPHKGVLVFNGPVDKPFEERDDNWVGHNELKFAEENVLCLISLKCLLEWWEEIQKQKVLAHRLWEKIHETDGVLPSPSSSGRS